MKTHIRSNLDTSRALCGRRLGHRSKQFANVGEETCLVCASRWARGVHD